MKQGIWQVCLPAICAFCLCVACSNSGETQQLAAGEAIYLSNCSHCHQPAGEGYAQIYPPLAGNPIVTLHDPTPTIEVVLHGRSAMPSFYDELTVEERAHVISYIRSAWGNDATPISRSQAQ